LSLGLGNTFSASLVLKPSDLNWAMLNSDSTIYREPPLWLEPIPFINIHIHKKYFTY
jgi:hypothetical protein